MLDYAERKPEVPYDWSQWVDINAEREEEAHRRFGAMLWGAALSTLVAIVPVGMAWSETSSQLSVWEAKLMIERQGSTVFKPNEGYGSPVLYGMGPCSVWDDTMYAFQVLAPNNQDWQHVYICDGTLSEPRVVYGEVIELPAASDTIRAA